MLPSSPAVKGPLYPRFWLRGKLNDFRVRRFARPGRDGLHLGSSFFNQLRSDGETHGSIGIRTVVDEYDLLAAQVFSAPYRPANTEVFQHRCCVCLRSFPRHSNRAGNIGGIERIGEANFELTGWMPALRQKVDCFSRWISIPGATRQKRRSRSGRGPETKRSVCDSCRGRWCLRTG